MKVPRWTPPDPTLIAARRQWARRYVDRWFAEPTYGKPEWVALADDDPRKLAAAVIVAESWATELDELPARLRIELQQLQAAEQKLWDDWRAQVRPASQAWARATVKSLLSPATRELSRRFSMTEAERVAEARRPRPNDWNPRPSESGEAA